MAIPSRISWHDHVSERETAHTWPDGQRDDAAWEDCTMDSAIEFARLTFRRSIPSTHREAEALRAASGEDPLGGTGIDDVIRGFKARYGWTSGYTQVSGFADLWTALKPGTAAIAQGKTGAFPAGHRLRRFDADFTGGHAVLVVRLDSQERVWWCDPLAPEGSYQGEWVTKAELSTYVRAFAGSHLTAPLLPVEADMPTLTTYQPGYTITVKATSNIRSTPYVQSGNLLRTIAAGATEKWTIVGAVKGGVDAESGSDVWYARWANGRWEYTAKANVTSGPTAPVGTAPVDTTPFDQADIDAAVKAATDPLKTQVTTLQTQLSAAQSALAVYTALKDALKKVLSA